MVKKLMLPAISVAGGWITHLLGGSDALLLSLFMLLAADYIAGLIVAGVFHASPKSCNGGLESGAGFKGLIRKVMILVMVAISVRLDLLLHTDFVRSSVIVGFSLNELISLVENAGLMGVPIPQALVNAIDLLRQKDAQPDKFRQDEVD